MTKHNASRVHWAKIWKIIRKDNKTALYDIAKTFGVDRHDVEFLKAVDQLVQQNRVRQAMGHTEEGMLCVCLIPNRDFFDEPDDNEEDTDDE
jgi:hypothetical protein